MSDAVQVSEKIIEALTPLAEKIGEGAEALYGIYVRQMVAEGAVGLVVVLVLTGLWVFATKKWFKYAKEVRKENEKRKEELRKIEEKEGYGAYHANRINTDSGFEFETGAVLLVGWGLLLTIGMGVAIDSALKLINPHYYAIQRILEVVTQ